MPKKTIKPKTRTARVRRLGQLVGVAPSPIDIRYFVARKVIELRVRSSRHPLELDLLAVWQSYHQQTVSTMVPISKIVTEPQDRDSTLFASFTFPLTVTNQPKTPEKP